ncbi:MAG: PQQ-dependent sugar dehydrogenase [Bacteriovoracaceae bacterium]|nr:PQQ-dependent sugar dehydrogenase [Bacteriovoracaceae bacterium]
MKIYILIALSLLSQAFAAPTAVSKFKVENDSFVIEKITDGLATIWAIEFFSETKAIFTEKSGQLYLLDTESGVVRTLKNPPVVYDSGQGGLLDVAIHPNFSKEPYIYVTYSKKVGSLQTTALARSRVNLQDESFEKWEDLLIARPAQSTAHHYGSRIAFDNKDHLFFTVGERGQAPLAQSLKAHMGKVLRLNLDGTIPSDNPYVATAGAMKEIWSYGHRNPQGIDFDFKTNTLYVSEHGPMGGDEINLIDKTKNYGWPEITYGREYSGGPVGRGESEREGMEQPIKYYVPSIAPNSLLVYRSNKMKFFKDRFLLGALALQHLNVIDIKNCKTACEDRLALDLNERIRDVKASPEGLVYFTTDSGRIYRIKEQTK